MDCHPSPVIHLLRSISSHPFPVIHLHHASISGRYWYPAALHLPMGFISCWSFPDAICLRPWYISGHNPSPAAIHFQLWSSWFEPFVSTLCTIALLGAVFPDNSCSSGCSLKVIITDLHNVRLPLTLPRSPIIHLVTMCPSHENTHSLTHPYGTLSFILNPWSGLLSMWSYTPQLQEYHSTELH